MTDKIQLRDAAREDIEQIAGIWRDYVIDSTANLGETPPTTGQVQQIADEIFSKRYPFIVAVEDSTVCGYAYVGPFNERWGYRFCGEDTIYLLPGHGGRGLGRRLLEALMQQTTTDTEFTQVLAKISVPADAALQDIPSCRLHTALGFREAGRLKNVGRKFGAWLDVVILQLDLYSGPSA